MFDTVKGELRAETVTHFERYLLSTEKILSTQPVLSFVCNSTNGTPQCTEIILFDQ